MYFRFSKRLPSHTAYLAIAFSFWGLASCGPSPQAGGGIGGTGSGWRVPSVASGPVTKMSSVFVSDTEYDNSNAIYCIDGEPCSTENSLKVGMVVLIKGTAHSSGQNTITRMADTITYEETVEGVVQSVAQDGSSLIVLGQLISVNSKTVIDASIPGQSIRNLKPQLDIIEVSGLVTSDGHILATLIMMRTGNPHYEVQGIIKNHDAREKRFEIGQLVLEYSAADISDMATEGALSWNGRLVHVRGENCEPRSEVAYGARLRATRVKRLGLTVEDSHDTKIEGFITQVMQSGYFSIMNHPIEILNDTKFEGGTANQITLGAHVFIHGTLIQGVLEAQEVVLKENVEMESNVESIDLQSGTLTLTGLPKLRIAQDARTVIEDHGIPSRFEDIRIGDHVKLHARLLDGAHVVATELERTNLSTHIVLQAPVQSADDPQIVLVNTSIDTSGIQNTEFLGLYGTIGRMAFFEKVAIGRAVWLKGTLQGSTATWTSVGINS